MGIAGVSLERVMTFPMSMIVAVRARLAVNTSRGGYGISFRQLNSPSFPFVCRLRCTRGLPGPIPESFGQLVELKELRLAHNQLSGE